MEMDAVLGARRRFDAPAATLHDLASPLFPRTLRRHRGVDGERIVGTAGVPPAFRDIFNHARQYRRVGKGALLRAVPTLRGYKPSACGEREQGSTTSRRPGIPAACRR